MTQETQTGAPARIGLVAIDALRIMGLRAILEDGITGTITELSATRSPDALGLDIILLDAAVTDHLFPLIALFRRLRPQPGIIVLGPENGFEHIQRIIAAGAKGYLNYAANEADLRMAIAVVRDGSVWAPRKVMARLLENTLLESVMTSPATVQFTKREQEVLRLLILGHPNRQIAAALGVDEGTVKAHMGRLMRKASVDNRTALTMKAIERSWA